MTDPGIYSSVLEDIDELDYSTDYFKKVQDFYALAANEGQAIITFIG